MIDADESRLVPEIEKAAVLIAAHVCLTKSVDGPIEPQSGINLVFDSAGFLEKVDTPADFAFLRGKDARSFLGDSTSFVGVQDRLIEGDPAKGRTCFYDLVEAAVLPFPERDGFTRPEIVAH